MKNRILAFFISSNNENSTSYKKAIKHVNKLCAGFNKKCFSAIFFDYNIQLIYEGNIDLLYKKDDDCFSFNVGSFVNQYRSCYSHSDKNDEIIDRFLKVEIFENQIIIKNDYAGTIPVFYSTREYVSLSNIEPIIVYDSKSSFDDISIEGLYGLLRYSHLIWDETLYKHIFTQEPDSSFTFTKGQLLPKKKYLNSIIASEKRTHFTNKEVANELYELNQSLISKSFENEEEIILPLSGGYDSRMIIAAIAKDSILKQKTKCFTYGPEGSLEIEAAKSLCKKYNIKWQRIDLPCNFLDIKYINQIADIFGSSLHFHGMYQLEFSELIAPFIDESKAILTSGFMTGVPAGQHINKLGIKKLNVSLTDSMNNFGQSRHITDDFLLKSSSKFSKNMIDYTEDKFNNAFSRIDGNALHKSIVFDVWTRQRNFISYHPRLLEWKLPFISPHMTVEYQNFFLSLNKKHITDRKAVELMFKYHYPESAKIISNSNSIRAISNPLETSLFYLAKGMRMIHLPRILPEKYSNKQLDFDIPAIRTKEKEGVYPIFHLQGTEKEVLNSFFSNELLEKIYSEAICGSIDAYQKLVYIQAFAFALKMIGEDKS